MRITLDTTPPPPPNGITVVQNGNVIEIIGAPGSVDPYAQVDVVTSQPNLNGDERERSIWLELFRVLIGVTADANGSFRIVINEPGLHWQSLHIRVTDRAGNESDPMPLPAPQPDRRNHPVGRLAGEFSVDPTGAANYRIPIDVPKGAAGMQPDLAFLYSSRAGNGHLGVGWSLAGLSAITRCPKTIAQDGVPGGGVRFDREDRFCLDGQRLIQHNSGIHGGTYTEYRTEIESFQKVISLDSSGAVPGRFEVRDKAGLVRHYGATSDARPKIQGTELPIMWAVSRIEDRNGNYIAFKYQHNDGIDGNGEHYPKEISWHNAQGVLIGRVVLDYENRTDKTAGYLQGAVTALTKRLRAIRVFSGTSTLARKYELEYEHASLSEQSVLASARMCSEDGSCLPRTRFGWHLPQESKAPYKVINSADTYTFGDIDGDGAVDFIYRGDGNIRIRYASRFDTPAETGIPALQDDGICSRVSDMTARMICIENHKLLLQNALVGDFDGDGYQDLLVPQVENRHYWLLRGAPDGLAIAEPRALHHGKNNKSDIRELKHTALDITGDGKSALLLRQGGTLHIARYENAQFSLVDTAIAINSNQNIHVLEADGDGRPDIYITAGNCSLGGGGGGSGGGGSDDPLVVINSACENMGTWRNTGQGFERYVHAAPNAKHPILIDANGDGLTDILRKQGSEWVLYHNTGAGWVDTGFRGGDWDHERIRVLDWNRDGKQDLMFAGYKGDWEGPYNEVWYVRVSRGDSFASKRDSGFNDGAHGNRYRSAQFMDLNGDGNADLFYSNGDDNYRLTPPVSIPQILLTGVTDGYGMETAVGYMPLNRLGTRYLGHTDEGLDPADRDKPNIRDFSVPMPIVQFFAQDTGRKTAHGKAVKVVTSYKYKGAKVDIHGRGFLGFAEVHASNANTGINTVNHHKQSFPYTGIAWKAEQRLPVAAPVLDIDNDGLRDGFFPPGCPGQQPHIAANECNFHPFVVNTAIGYAEDTPGQLVSRSVSTLESRPLGKVIFVSTRNTTEHEYDLNNGDPIRRVRTAYEYDDNGNATSVQVRTDDGVGVGNDHHSVSTDNTYADNSARWLLGRLSSSTVTHHAPHAFHVTRRAAFEYDTVTGLLVRETLEPGDPDLELVTNYTHDAFGNVINRTVSSGASGDYAIAPRTTSTQYDQKGVYPESVTNALGHSETYAWDARFNAKRMSTGPNGLTTTWQFDSFGRVIREIAPRTALQTTTERNWCGGGTPCRSEAAEIRIHTTAGTGAETVTELDRLGREVFSYSRGLDNEYIASETWYDLLGRTYLASDPYRLDDPVVCYSFREYDTLNRVVAEHRPANAYECDRRSSLDIKRLYDHNNAPPRYSAVTSFEYSGLTHTVTAPAGANGKQRKVRRTENVAGRLLNVTEWDDTDTAIQTHYSYIATGETASVTPPSGHAVTLQYDKRGRKTAMHDPDMGHWQYRHNALGELVRQTDAKGQVTRLSYDVLGRMVERREPEGITTWAYDTATGKGIGKLATVWQHDGYHEALRYNEHGELDTHLKIIDGLAYFTRNTYDAYGRLRNLYYPAARDIPAVGADVTNPDTVGALKLTHLYSGSGALKRVHRTDGGRDELLWQVEAISARGQITRASLGNHLANNAVFDAATGLVTELGVGPDGNSNYTQQYQQYEWDVVGNLTRREDRLNETLETFRYDRLYRLTRSTLGAGNYSGTQNFEYDTAGNLKRKGNLRNYQYGEGANGQTRPHAVIGIERYAGGNPVETLAYLYDANGNVEDANGRHITWSSDNKPLLIEKDGAYSRFNYGPDRARYKHEKRYKNGDKEITHYGGLTERLERTKNGTTSIEYRQHIQAGGQVIAIVTDYVASGMERINYLHRDHLGSIALITDEEGKIHEQHKFDAWGAATPLTRLTPNPWKTSAITDVTTNRGFTGHEMLDHLGLIHMNGRIYDPQIGRFLSADPFVQFPHSTQGYNRYSYLNNNPLNATDPSGYRSFKQEFGRVLMDIAPLLNLIPVCYVWCAALASAIGGYLYTGSAQVGLRAGALSVASSVAVMGASGFSNIALKAAVGGIAGGLISMAGGGRFGDGFLGGIVGSLIGGPAGTGNMPTDMIVGAIAGGAVSVIGGGKFKNGAVSGAFAAAVRNKMRAPTKDELIGMSPEKRQKHLNRMADIEANALDGSVASFAGLYDSIKSWGHRVLEESQFYGRFGGYLGLRSRAGPLRVNVQIDAYSVWFDGQNFHYTQGLAFELSVSNVDILSVGYSRSGRAMNDLAPWSESGFRWDGWQPNAGVYNVTSGQLGPTWSYGIGVGIGPEVSIPIDPR